MEYADWLISAGTENFEASFIKAAERGNLPMMRRLFGLGVDIEKVGGSSLAKAAYYNHVDAVKFLMEKGVYFDTDDCLPVLQAARQVSLDVLRIFFEAGLKPEQCGPALRKTAASPHAFAAVKFLVDAGVDPINHPHYSLDELGEPVNPPFLPADAAAEARKPEVADYLRGKPIDVEALLAQEEARRKSWNAIDDDAIRAEEERKIAHLLRGEARAEGVRRAVTMAHAPALKPFLNEQGKDGRTALGLAARNGDVEIIAALLQAGADPNKPDALQNSPIYQAAYAGHTRVVERLL